MKHKQTKKLFYGKWPYKVTYLIRGISVLRERSSDQIVNYIANATTFGESTWRNNFHRDVTENSEVILDVAYFLESQPKETYQIRIETNTLDVYTDSTTMVEKLLEFHTERISYVYKPAPGTEQILSNKNIILVNKLPSNKFKHKVFLSPHKTNDTENKALIVKWIKEQRNLHITDSTAQWFITTHWNWDRRYIMAEDEKALLMLKLRCGDIVGSIYDYQVVDK